MTQSEKGKEKYKMSAGLTNVEIYLFAMAIKYLVWARGDYFGH